jgi:hypothetical protein
MRVCFHTTDSGYSIQNVALKELSSIRTSVSDMIEAKTKPHPDALGGRIWDPDETLYWQMDTEYDFLTYDQQIDIIKDCALQPSLLTKLKIQQRRRKTADAQIVWNWLGAKDEPYLKKHQSVLAFAIGPGGGIGGDITMNADQLWLLRDTPLRADEAKKLGYIENFEDPTNHVTYYDPKSTGGHEFGHALGMEHISAQHFSKIALMFPYYNKLRHYGEPDLEYIFRLYPKIPHWKRVARVLEHKMGKF